MKLDLTCTVPVLYGQIRSGPMRYTFRDHLKRCIQPMLTEYSLEPISEVKMVRGLVIDVQRMPRHIKQLPGSIGIRPNDLEVNEGIGP